VYVHRSTVHACMHAASSSLVLDDVVEMEGSLVVATETVHVRLRSLIFGLFR
jgi:hypothetical protein